MFEANAVNIDIHLKLGLFQAGKWSLGGPSSLLSELIHEIRRLASGIDQCAYCFINHINERDGIAKGTIHTAACVFCGRP